MYSQMIVLVSHLPRWEALCSEHSGPWVCAWCYPARLVGPWESEVQLRAWATFSFWKFPESCCSPPLPTRDQ